jgi:integrase
MIYKRGEIWWYKFAWNGELIRESTKQSNKRVAGQIESAHKTSLAKGEVGIRERKSSPTLIRAVEDSFLPFLAATKAEEPNTISFYKVCAKNLLAWPKLANMRLDRITSETITEFIKLRQDAGAAVATINRELATLRRVLRLASEWGVLATAIPRIALLSGEHGRERVLTLAEESDYLAAAEPLMRTVATIMLDCALRPDEVYRLTWQDSYRDGRLIVHSGKTRAARRSVPVTPRVAALLEMMRTTEDGWIFPTASKSGHMGQSTVKKSHLRALKSSKVVAFVLYDLRHTCLTRWAQYLDAFTLKKLAGHESLSTTMKYVHLNERDSDARLSEARERIEFERGGHKIGHSADPAFKAVSEEVRKSKKKEELWCARRGSNPRPNDSKSFALSS